jgi:dTDP-4-dehydrorhamnose reductase
MNPTLLVIGSNGLIGTTLLSKGKEAGFDVVGADIGEVDITNAESVSSLLDRMQEAPLIRGVGGLSRDGEGGFVINAAAYTDVEGCETPEGFEIASRVNGDGPGILAKACRERGIGLIHLSTDYVFNGTDLDGVSEEAVPDETMNAYGKTKRAGELAVIEAAGGLQGSDFIDADCGLYVVRLSWLFGQGSKNFVGKIIARAKTQGEISVVDDEIGCPLYTEDFADFLLAIVHDRPATGIYHEGGQGSCSRFDFASEVISSLGIQATVKPCKLADFPRKSHIAPISILKNTKRPPLRSWKEMVGAYAKTARAQ